MMIVTDQRTDALKPLRQSLSVIVHPVLTVINAPFRLLAWSSESVIDRNDLLEENRQLRAEALTLKARLQKFQALETENIRLQALLESSFKLGEQFIVTSLISVNTDPYQHKVIVDKGSQFDVYEGQAALDADGVMGQVVRVNPLSSEIMLITDPNHAIPVEVNRNGLRTVAVGSGQFNRLELPHLPHNSDIQIGDMLTTSGLGGRFPKGYPVAVVSELEPAPGFPFMRAAATPVAHIESSRELLLVWSNRQPIPLLKEPTSVNPENLETPESEETAPVDASDTSEEPVSD